MFEFVINSEIDDYTGITANTNDSVLITLTNKETDSDTLNFSAELTSNDSLSTVNSTDGNYV